MAEATRRGSAAGVPEYYYWAAVWWRLHARESAHPAEATSYSRSLLMLYRDMLARPEHYADWRRPPGSSDWTWSGLGRRLATPSQI